MRRKCDIICGRTLSVCFRAIPLFLLSYVLFIDLLSRYVHLSQLFQVYICRCNFRFFGYVYSSFCHIFAWVLSKMVQNIEARKALVPVTKQVSLSTREYTTPRLVAARRRPIAGKQGISVWAVFLVSFGTIWILDALTVLRLINRLVFWVWNE